MENRENIEELSFEQALTRLEDIVERLSTGSGNLDEIVRMYETGIKYLSHCRAKLEEAETKISTIRTDMAKTVAKEEEDGL
ncbi:MAG: exodeoxyribonuclease VII small subunit [Candidatus Cloacimonadaceae bacterium]|nr:exodeoxyribonuclease VII small subunit [Candidatus Cloacimonadaceae bacterium]